ncbi:hypothetical protein ACVWZK_001735 [Bradyrhizobium sp. GM0.4]
MNPYTLIEKLAGNHGKAWEFAMLVLSQTKAEMPDAHKLGGIANLSVGDNDEIDAYVDLVEASTLQAFLDELNTGRVQFTNLDVDGRPASLVRTRR